MRLYWRSGEHDGERGGHADQALSATDSDRQPRSRSRWYRTDVRDGDDDDTWTGTGTGNLHLAPGCGRQWESSTYRPRFRASDGSLTDQKSRTITVNNVNQAPVWRSLRTDG